VRHWHAIGQEADRLWWKLDSNSSSMAGVDALAKSKGYSLQDLYQAMDFYWWFHDPGDLETLLARRGQGGIHITWKHITSLLKVNRSHRNDALEEVFARGMSAREVAYKVAKHNRRKRVLRIPHGTQAKLKRIDGLVAGTSEVIEQCFEHGVYEPLMNASEELNQGVIKLVAETRGNVEGLIAQLQEVAAALAEVEEHLGSLGLPPEPPPPPTRWSPRR
jgi:hypothetical protein